MTFTSFIFLLFFPSVIIVYNLLPQQARMCFLLVVSYGFYAFMQPVYLLLLIGITGVTYSFTRWMGMTEDERKRRRLMILGIILILLPLFFFKYFNFVNETVFALMDVIGLHRAVPVVHWMLPVGISFYTFMAIGYLIDVNNEEVEIEKNLVSVGLFLSFFPIILSGPIERAGNLFPQWKSLKRSEPADLTAGLKMMLWGYFMKLCVADRLGIYVDTVLNNFTYHNGSSLAVASLLYPFQVYGDLGGYSLIAIGVARCLGVKIIPNFNRPFFATSMSEFWRRWHMSFINWLLDYIFTPLSFSLRNWKNLGVICALMLTFFISGIWHGAAYTFVVWGVVQGLFLSVEVLMKKKRIFIENKYQLNKKWWYVLTCCVLVYFLFAFSEIIEKSATITDACVILEKIIMEKGKVFEGVPTYGIICLLILFFKDLRDEFFPNKIRLFESPYIIIRFISYALIASLIVAIGVLDGGQFIYFQF